VRAFDQAVTKEIGSFSMTEDKNRQGRLRPRYGYALLIVYLIGCAGGAFAVYRNRGHVPEAPPIPSITK
jgi:hypothetical protein